MRYIATIFIRKAFGAWGSGMNFQSFYFNYDNREDLIRDSTMVKCVDQEGEIIPVDEAYPIYLKMEKMLIEQNNNLDSSVSLNKSGFKFFLS